MTDIWLAKPSKRIPRGIPGNDQPSCPWQQNTRVILDGGGAGKAATNTSVHEFAGPSV